MPEQELGLEKLKGQTGDAHEVKERSKSWKYGTALDLTVLLAISVLSTVILIRDLPIRLCDIISDECLVAHCKFFLNPQVFVQDVEFQSWARVALSSMLNWLPAVLCQVSGLEPEKLYMPALILQNSLIVTATYLLSRKITQGSSESRKVSLLAAAFTMLWHPQWWNSSLIYNLDWMPYSNWMALAFLLLSFVFTLEQRKWLANFLIVIGTLIHPILGCLASGLTSLHRIREATKERKKAVVLESAITTGITASLVFIPIHFSTVGLEFAPDTDRLSVLAINIHATPWGNHYPYGISSFVASLIFAGLFSVIALLPCPGKPKDSRGQNLTSSAVILAFSATAIHCLAAFLKLAAVQNLIISRSTILLLALCIPLVMWQVWTVLAKGSIAAGLTILTFLFAASPTSLLALTMTVASQRLRDIGKAPMLSVGLQGIAAGISTIILCYHTPLKEVVLQQIFEPTMGPMLPQMISQNRNLVFDWRLFGLSFLTFLSVKYLLKFEAIFKNDKAVAQEDGKRRSHLILSWCLCLILFTSLSIACCVENRKRAKPDIEKIKKYHEVQLWAREHTRNEASFVLVNPTINSAWRTYTGRPVIAYKEIIQVYCSTMQIVDFNTRLKRFKELHPPVFRKEKGDAEDFNTANWLAFAKEFGADYMVRRKDWPPLELPVEFQNSEFVIYRLKTSN